MDGATGGTTRLDQAERDVAPGPGANPPARPDAPPPVKRRARHAAPWIALLLAVLVGGLFLAGGGWWPARQESDQARRNQWFRLAAMPEGPKLRWRAELGDLASGMTSPVAVPVRGTPAGVLALLVTDQATDHGAAGTGRVQVREAGSGAVTWSSDPMPKLGGCAGGGPVITCVAGDDRDGRFLVAYDADDGRVLHRTARAARLAGGALADGTFVTITASTATATTNSPAPVDLTLAAFGPDGRQRWQRGYRATYASAATTGLLLDDGRIVVLSAKAEDGRELVVDADSGALSPDRRDGFAGWVVNGRHLVTDDRGRVRRDVFGAETRPVPPYARQILPDERGGAAAIVMADHPAGGRSGMGTVTMVDADSQPGRVLWTLAEGTTLTGRCGDVAVGRQVGDDLVALRWGDGTMAWNRPVISNELVMGMACDGDRAVVAVSPPALSTASPDRSGVLEAFSATDGTKAWGWDPGVASSGSSPTVITGIAPTGDSLAVFTRQDATPAVAVLH